MRCPHGKFNNYIDDLMVYQFKYDGDTQIFKDQQPSNLCEEGQYDHQSYGDRLMCPSSFFHHSLDIYIIDYTISPNNDRCIQNLYDMKTCGIHTANKSHMFLQVCFDNLGHFPARLLLQFLKLLLVFSCDGASTVWKSIKPWPRIHTEIIYSASTPQIPCR